MILSSSLCSHLQAGESRDGTSPSTPPSQARALAEDHLRTCRALQTTTVLRTSTSRSGELSASFPARVKWKGGFAELSYLPPHQLCSCFYRLYVATGSLAFGHSRRVPHERGQGSRRQERRVSWVAFALHPRRLWRVPQQLSLRINAQLLPYTPPAELARPRPLTRARSCPAYAPQLPHCIFSYETTGCRRQRSPISVLRYARLQVMFPSLS